MNNTILKAAIITARIIQIMVSVSILVLVIIMITWPMNPEFYDRISLALNNGVFTISTIENAEVVPFSEYAIGYVYYALLKALFISITFLAILKTVLKLIRSIKDLRTFRKENVESFRNIGLLFILLLILNITTIRETGGTMTLTVQFLLNYAVYSLICFVLAEIFKEGNRLHEETQLTI